jgi:hypothetical protein
VAVSYSRGWLPGNEQERRWPAGYDPGALPRGQVAWHPHECRPERPAILEQDRRDDHPVLHKGASPSPSGTSWKNADEVRRFLRVYPDAPDVLLEARPYIERVFGPTTQVVLEVTFDPDSESPRGSEELFGNIRTSLPVEEALDRLNQFDSEWFLAQLARAGGRLNFNLDFV